LTTLRAFISQQIDLSDEEWALWEDIIKIKHFKKGEQITFKDNIWTDFIFVNSGLIRSYIINNEGKDHTWQFNFNTEESLLEHFFAVDYASIVQNIPSCRGFEVLEDSEVLIYSKKDFYELCEEHKKYERIGRLIAQAAYLVIKNIKGTIMINHILKSVAVTSLILGSLQAGEI